MDARFDETQKKALINECYEFWKEKLKYEEDGEKKAVILKSYRILSVYALKKEGQISDPAFVSIINRFHPSKEIAIKAVIFDVKMKVKDL